MQWGHVRVTAFFLEEEHRTVVNVLDLYHGKTYGVVARHLEREFASRVDVTNQHTVWGRTHHVA
jgi:hypothetical protein